jgi:hypothetical protein
VHAYKHIYKHIDIHIELCILYILIITKRILDISQATSLSITYDLL